MPTVRVYNFKDDKYYNVTFTLKYTYLPESAGIANSYLVNGNYYLAIAEN